jgi:hypothetical protein
MTPAQSLLDLESELADYALHYRTTLGEVSRKVGDATRRGQSVEDFALDRIVEVLQGDSRATLEVAVAYWLLAGRLLGEKGLEAAWPAMAKAERHAGRVERLVARSIDDVSLMRSAPGPRTGAEISAMGGRGKRSSKDPGRERLALLLAKKPEGGWKGPTHTSKVLGPVMEKQEPDIARLSTSWTAAVLRWIGEDGPVREAYLANAAPKKKKR